MKDLDAVAWPIADNPTRFAGLRPAMERMRAETDRAIILNLRNATFALSQRLRGFSELLEDLILNPAFATALQERVSDVVCGIAAAALREADDMGTQTQPFMSPALYRSMVKPHHARLVATLRAGSSAKVVMHNDGAIAGLIPDFIDIGVDAINPVQVNATGMDPARLKREFGAHLSFWGGVDTQRILPYGSPQDVADEVRRRLGDLGRGGGYVLAAVHNIQAEVPPANVVAMYDTALAASGAAIGGSRLGE